MNAPALVSQHARICDVIKKSKALADLELQAHLGRYACVLVAGFAENAISEIYGQYCSLRSEPPVAGFAIKHLERYQNPKAGRFVEVAAAFSAGWASDLKNFLDLDGRGAAIDSIMSNRHLIAHGGMPGITLVRVEDYLKKVVEVLEFIERQCGV